MVPNESGGTALSGRSSEWANQTVTRCMPIDEREEADLIVEAGFVVQVPPGEGKYVSHIDVCPVALWRKRRRNNER